MLAKDCPSDYIIVFWHQQNSIQQLSMKTSMKRLSIFLTISFCCISCQAFIFLGQTSSAQESPAVSGVVEPNYAASENEAKELGPKNKEFMEKFEQFNKCVAKLNALKVEYPMANQQRQTEIDKEYENVYGEGSVLNKAMLQLGLDAFNESPNRNPMVNSYIYNLISWEFFRDNYDRAYDIFKAIAGKGVVSEGSIYYVYGAFAALMTMHLDDAEAWMKKAQETGNIEKFQSELEKSEKGREQLRTLQTLASQIPTFKKNWALEQEIRKAETEAGEKDPAQKLPRVLLTTSKGDIIIELFENEAPNTVANFISLVEKGKYNGTPFHRVLPMFMAQGGDVQFGNGMGGPGYGIDCENKTPKARKHFRGSLSMAHAGANTGGSQFFLTFVPTFFLDREANPPGHTVFGRVVEGMDVLSEIQRIDPSDEDAMLPVPDKIVEAKVLNKRDHEYEPIKNAARR